MNARQIRERRGTVIRERPAGVFEVKCRMGHVFILDTNREWEWCPRCPQSAGEKIIEKYLRKRQKTDGINFRPEFPIPFTGKVKYYFDFLVRDIRLLIEFDGEQHFKETGYFKRSLKEQREIDRFKDKWALKHGYHLLRIKFDQIKHIEEILDETLDMIETLDKGVVLCPEEDYYE